jgi:hypothetical protein
LKRSLFGDLGELVSRIRNFSSISNQDWNSIDDGVATGAACANQMRCVEAQITMAGGTGYLSD